MSDEFKAFRQYMETLNWSPSLQQRMRHDLSNLKLPSDVLPGEPGFDAHAALADLIERWKRYPLNNDEAIDQHWKTFLPKRMATVSAPLAVDMPYYRFIYSLFVKNHIYWTQQPNTLDREGLRMLSLRLEPDFLPAAEEAIEKIAREIIKLLPASAFYRPLPSDILVPLCDQTSNAKYFPTWLCGRTDEYRYKDHRILFMTNANLIDCIYEANGITHGTYNPQKHKLTFCVEAQGPPATVLRKYLPRDSDLLEMLTTPIPFNIPRDKFGAHGIIVAPSEHGKTQLLSSFIARFVAEGETGLVVLDPHGDLFKALSEKVPPDRLILLDPSTNPPPMNMFDFGDANDVQILQAFTYLMSALTGGMTEKQSGILPYLLKLIRIIPGATVATLLQIVTDRAKEPAYLKYLHQLPPLDRDFFLHQFIGKMQETKDAIAWKLSHALAYDAFRAMFTAPTNTFDAFAAIEQRKVVLVKGSEKVLGEHGFPVFLQFVVALFFLAALKRDEIPENDRKLCIIFADEAKHIFNNQTARILTECRKYRVGFLAATQLIQQIPQEVKAAVYGSTAIKIAGPVAHTDAMLLAREMYTTPDEIRSCRSYQRSHAEWMIHVSNVTEEAIKVSVPFGAIDQLADPPRPSVIITPPPIPQPPPIPEHFSVRDTPPQFSVGDWVVLLVDGLSPEEIQFANTPRRITDIQHHGGIAYHFVEGVGSAALEHHLKKTTPPQPAPPHREPNLQTAEQNPSHAGKTDVELVITTARRLETLLEKILGATGRGLHEKLTAATDKLPPEIVHRARYVATMRNKVVHVDDFSLPDRDWFLQCARSVEAFLDPPQSPPKPDLGMREPD